MTINQSHQPAFNPALHLVRGLCAVGVAAYHYLDWEHGIAIESAGAFLVYVFFTLSALTMMIAHAEHFESSITFPQLVAFYRKRAARILPLLAFVAILAPAYGMLLSGASVSGEMLAHTFLTASTLMGLQMPGFTSGVVAAWSLGIEAVFYLVFPVLALMAMNVSLRALLVATALLVIGQQSAILLIAGDDGATFWFRYVNPLVFAPFFAIGIIIFLKPLRARSGGYFWLSIMALAAIAGFSLAIPVDVYRNPAAYLVLTTLTAGAVLTAYSARVPSWATKSGVMLGNISYALYLTHWFAYKGSSWLAPKLGNEYVQPLLYAGLATTFAYLLFRFLEVPARNYLRGELPSPRSSAGPLRSTSD
ncbi:acyltransferase [Devosia sp. XK-2]|uniref:acyltransferase family protein n=1 Tax=Devosia sp. XK-2 TaxID=3126689 RepID=UPI0030CA6EBA